MCNFISGSLALGTCRSLSSPAIDALVTVHVEPMSLPCQVNLSTTVDTEGVFSDPDTPKITHMEPEENAERSSVESDVPSFPKTILC